MFGFRVFGTLIRFRFGFLGRCRTLVGCNRFRCLGGFVGTPVRFGGFRPIKFIMLVQLGFRFGFRGVGTLIRLGFGFFGRCLDVKRVEKVDDI